MLLGDFSHQTLHFTPELCPKRRLLTPFSGNYREHRYFTPWLHRGQTEQYHLPRMIQEVVGATHVTFGDAVISTPDTCFGSETCEELFTVKAPHLDMSLDGVELFSNSSGSHFTLQKLDTRLQLITEATRKCGGIYLYANQQGQSTHLAYMTNIQGRTVLNSQKRL